MQVYTKVPNLTSLEIETEPASSWSTLNQPTNQSTAWWFIGGAQRNYSRLHYTSNAKGGGDLKFV